jgi:hypothetical protein
MGRNVNDKGDQGISHSKCESQKLNLGNSDFSKETQGEWKEIFLWLIVRSILRASNVRAQNYLMVAGSTLQLLT